MSFVAHQMHSRICPTVVRLQLWKFEIWGIAGIPDFLSERIVIDVVHVVLIGAASREALNQISESIAFKKLLQTTKIRAGAPSVECRRKWKLVSYRLEIAARGSWIEGSDPTRFEGDGS